MKHESEALRQLIDAQDGLVTRRQALEHGLSPAAVRHRLGEVGRWQRLASGIYVTFNGPLSTRHRVRALLLYGGDSGVLSGGYACRAFGLRYVPERAPLLVLVPAGVQRMPTPLGRIERTRVMPSRRLLGSYPVASPERSAVDACRWAGTLRATRALLCEVVQQGLSTPNRLAVEVHRPQWHGSHYLRLALHDLVAGCRPAPECDLRDLVRSSLVLGEPLWNRPLPGVIGEPLTPDAHWDDADVVVEIDSAEWHRFGDSVEATEQRRARYAALGKVVLSIAPRRLREEPGGVLSEMEAAVIRRRRTQRAA